MQDSATNVQKPVQNPVPNQKPEVFDSPLEDNPYQQFSSDGIRYDVYDDDPNPSDDLGMFAGDY